MLVTICTPAYNRETLLKDLYQSLQRQTSTDFEWIIVDDGSTDHTEELVARWMTAPPMMNIRYLKKENGGKHTALNVGIAAAQGKYFIIVDSDDYLNENAVEIICEEFARLPEGHYAGVGFTKVFEDGKTVGTSFDGEYVDCTSLERKKYHIDGDKAEVFYTDVIKKYPFPVFKGERFLTEALVWNRIAHDGYKIRWVNKGFYICRYQPDGLSMQSPATTAFQGYTLFIKELLSYKETLLLEKVRWLGVYADVAARKGLSNREIAKRVQTSVGLVTAAKSLYQLKKRSRRNARAEELRIGQGGKDTSV